MSKTHVKTNQSDSEIETEITKMRDLKKVYKTRNSFLSCMQNFVKKKRL